MLSKNDTSGSSSQGLTVITTHINADFDAFASMIAAQKLYPEALVVFPGSQEKGLRDFFVKSMVYLYNIVKIKDVDLNAVTRLILVDTRQASRIGKFASIVERPGLEIHIYDHHPPMPDDLSGSVVVTQMVGATVTILTKILRDKKIPITPEEATIMALGLYEDTGSFTFKSTTEDDYLAAAYLLSKGANLNVVSDLITREITPEQVSLLNDMIEGITHRTIHGVDVAITTASSEIYVGDFALLVHKLRDMQNLDVIFALASMENRVYLVARSRLPEIDAGEVAMAFGGGGHPTAASATIKGQTLVQVEERLLAVLSQIIKPKRSAKDLMSSPVIHVDPDVVLTEANKLLTRYNVNVLVVLESDNLLGIISRQVIEKALHHKLDHVPVREFMTTEIDTVTPDASLSEIQEKIIGNKQRLLPVMENGCVTGVITRTDLLNILVSEPAQIPRYMVDGKGHEDHVRKRSVVKFLAERLPEEIIKLLRTIGEVADDLGYNAYAVGGFVRDIFLYQKNLDIDVVIEGDGIPFAKSLAASLGGRVRAHQKFNTAVVILPDGQKIDVATARLEYYKSPGALPTVEMGSIKLDLYRRDFTINTLAIKLNPDRFGILIDFFGAQKDLKQKVIRVLHNLSFVEDPTRVFRAVRFEQRFGFKMGKLTLGLIENAVKMDFFRELSGRRLFSELRHILDEDNPVMALRRLNEFKLLKVIHPKIVYNGVLEALLNSVEKVLTWHNLLFLEESCRRWVLYLMALMKSLDPDSVQELCDRLELTQRHRKVLINEKIKAENCLRWMASQKVFKNSDLYKKLRPFRTETLLYMMASTTHDSIQRAISNYVTRLRSITTLLGGKDLKKMGFKPGPIYREILGRLLDARLNGEVKTRMDEVEFVRKNWRVQDT
ncbi:MAG: CBS domain-containing protein [Deltaproteobacteria bacterium]|nr:CBS domain-containing protein [Deltaproteobacteria bacterium]MBW2018903.1 CBS domain-containing protein [Deltaproteobacteria bacterium]MBW2073658.1 CBS domain-containing protein [Deltaproteobacteria bacterium]RLB81176.1 MAG: polya polymerase [Deltaproteobacteria bacterium]